MSQYQRYNSIVGEDENSEIIRDIRSINFTGSGVEATSDQTTGEVTVTIKSSSSSSYPTVTNYSSLPLPSEYTNEIYIVEEAEGTWFINRKPSGLYISDGITWTHLNNFNQAFNDNNTRFYNASNDTKRAALDCSGISPSTTQTYTFPNKSGVLALDSDILTVAGTTGAIQFNDSGVLAADSLFFWDGVTHRLGVGTSLPTSSCHIQSATEQLRLGYNATNYCTTTIASNGSTTVATYGSNANYHIDFSNSTAGDFLVNNRDLYVQTSTHRVGIGTSTPSHYLTLNRTGRVMKFGAFEFTVGQNPTFTGQGFRVDGGNRTIQLLGSGGVVADDEIIKLSNGAGGNTAAVMRRETGNDCRQVLISTNSSGHTFNPAAGNVAFASLEIQTPIAQSGTASGITRGVFVNQPLTHAPNYRGVEVALGTHNGHGFYQSGGNATNRFEGSVDASKYLVGGVAGASGSFTSADGKTITVTNGLITNIT